MPCMQNSIFQSLFFLNLYFCKTIANKFYEANPIVIFLETSISCAKLIQILLLKAYWNILTLLSRKFIFISKVLFALTLVLRNYLLTVHFSYHCVSFSLINSNNFSYLILLAQFSCTFSLLLLIISFSRKFFAK